MCTEEDTKAQPMQSKIDFFGFKYTERIKNIGLCKSLASPLISLYFALKEWKFVVLSAHTLFYILALFSLIYSPVLVPYHIQMNMVFFQSNNKGWTIVLYT